MMKKIIALAVSIFAMSALVPVYADKGNVAKEMWDLSGLSFDWRIENPNDDGYDAYHSLQILQLHN